MNGIDRATFSRYIEGFGSTLAMAYRESALEMEDIDHASPSRDDLDGDGFVQTLHPLLRPGVHNRDIRSKIIQSIIKNTIFPSHNKMVPSLPKEAHTTPDQGTASHTYIFNLRKMKEDVSQYTTAHQDPTVEVPLTSSGSNDSPEVKSAPSDGKSAVQMTAGSLPVGGRGRKKAKHAEYKVPVKQVPNLSWRLAPAIKAAPSVSCSMFYDKLPHMWAEDEEDVISAIQTHPDIFKAGGIGTEGSCLNYLVLSGTGWQDIEWVSPYVMLVRRSWKFKKVGTKRPRPTRTETPNPRKRVRFDSKPLEENTLSETLTPDSHTRRTLIEKEKKGNSHLPKQQQHDEYPSNIAHKSDVEMSFGSAKKHVHTFTEGPPTLQGLTSSVTLDERHDKTNEVLIYKPRTHNTPQLNHTCDIPDENNLAEFYNHSYGLQDPMATSLNNSSQIVTPPLQPIAPEIPTYSLQRESWSVGSGDAAVLPEESQYFQTALETRHPVVIFARNDSPFARSSPSTLWTYAFMGFFVVADFRIHSTVENEDTGTTQLYITFKWVGNGSLCNQPNPYPWWISEEPTSENSMDFLSDISDRDRAMCSSLTCFTHIALYPKSEESLNEDDTTECNDDFFENLSCWLCTHCGKLNAIIPFRLRWSWTCRYCKNVGRSTEDMNFRPVIFREAYHLPPPLPVESAISPTTHSVQFFKALERAIVYRFKLSNILLQHIPSTDEDTQKAYESLYCTIQQRIDFMPCDTEHSLLRFDYPSPQIAQTDITFLLTAFHTFIKDRPKLTDDPNCMVEPHGIQCAFWPSKGISKTQPFKANRHVLFIALGSTCDLTFSIKRIKTEKKKNDTLTLVMPHGSMLFFHHHDESTVTYKVARTDKLLLLTCYWDDVQDENIMANTSNITSNTL